MCRGSDLSSTHPVSETYRIRSSGANASPFGWTMSVTIGVSSPLRSSNRNT